MLPPREGFSSSAVGAIGLLVHRLSDADDLILGRQTAAPPFADRRFVAVRPRGCLIMRAAVRYAAGVAAILRQAPPDLIEVHNRPEVASLLARRFPGLPVMLFLHNDPQGMRLARTPAERRRLTRHVRLVAVSDHVRRRYQGSDIDALPIRLLPNCLDLSTLPLPRPDASRDRLILFVGRLVADKGADSFVAACALALPRLAGWRAEMIGADRFQASSPDTPFLRALRSAAARAGVVLTGYQTHAGVLETMARAAIVVVPSRWQEPFGLTALEAMASGAALVTSGRGGLAELTGEDAAILIDPDAPATLAEALMTLAADPSGRARLVAAGHRRASLYDLPLARARLAALRRDALAGAAGPRRPVCPADVAPV